MTNPNHFSKEHEGRGFAGRLGSLLNRRFLGGGDYDRDVSPETKALAEQADLGKTNRFIPGAELPAYYPDSVREILRVAAAIEYPTPDPDTVKVA